jgi:hypothetical protein
MPAGLIVFAALSCFLPLLAAETAKPVAVKPGLTKPDLSDEAAVMEKVSLVVASSD